MKRKKLNGASGRRNWLRCDFNEIPLRTERENLLRKIQETEVASQIENRKMFSHTCIRRGGRPMRGEIDREKCKQSRFMLFQTLHWITNERNWDPRESLDFRATLLPNLKYTIQVHKSNYSSEYFFLKKKIIMYFYAQCRDN